jgi:hypothetical protein
MLLIFDDSFTPRALNEPVLSPDVFRAYRDFIVNSLDSQGNDHVAWEFLKISDQWTTLVLQIRPLALPNTRIR